MPDHTAGLNAPAHPQFGQRILDGEDSGLRKNGLRHGITQLVGYRLRGIEKFAQIQAEIRFKNRGAIVDFLAEDRFRFIKSAAHIRLLRALARKKKATLRRS